MPANHCVAVSAPKKASVPILEQTPFLVPIDEKIFAEKILSTPEFASITDRHGACLSEELDLLKRAFGEGYVRAEWDTVREQRLTRDSLCNAGRYVVAFFHNENCELMDRFHVNSCISLIFLIKYEGFSFYIFPSLGHYFCKWPVNSSIRT